MQQHNPSGPSSLASSPFSQVFPGARDFEVQGSQFVVVHGNMIHQTASSPMGFGPQQGLQTPQMIVPNTPSPETAVNSESGNYSNQLLRQGRGFPLYFPGPQINLAAEYRRTGVAIGDVGRVTPEGSFDFFFNIYLPANHPINANIPEDFVPLTPYNPVDVAHHKFDPGNYVSSPSVHKANDDFPEFPGGEFAFNCGGSNGAVLALPHGAYLEKLENLESMRRYATKHAESWYKYVNGARGRGLVNGDLYLVTGCEKAKSWGMASYHDVPLHREFQLSFRPTTDEDNGYRYRWQGTHSHYKHADSPPVDESPLNQTTFIHVFAISVSEGIWGRLFGSETCQLVNSSTFLDKSGRGYVPYGFQESSLRSLFGIGSIFGGSASSGGKKYTEGVYVPSDGIVTDAFPIYKIFHPSQIIHERILRKAPGAKVVITHDDDWRDVFRDDGMEAMGKSLSELQDAIFDRFQIMEEDGAAFLMAKPHTTVSKDAADPLFERVIDADNMEVEFLLNFPDTQRDPGPDDHSVSYDSSSPHGNARGQDDKPPSKASSRSSTDTNFSPILAPDQPLTIQGKPPAHVVVACIQCQTRKIRCDGAEPMCNNCGRRGSTECNYYPLPERRGPDKMLSISARQRVSGSENEPALK